MADKGVVKEDFQVISSMFASGSVTIACLRKYIDNLVVTTQGVLLMLFLEIEPTL